jgi:hypothetical protein
VIISKVQVRKNKGVLNFMVFSPQEESAGAVPLAGAERAV